MGPLPPNLVSVQPRDPSSRSAAAPAPATWVAESVLDPEAQERQRLAPAGGVAGQLATTLARLGKPYSRTCRIVLPRVHENVSSTVVASAGSASHPSDAERSGRFASMTFPHPTASTDGGHARGPRPAPAASGRRRAGTGG